MARRKGFGVQQALTTQEIADASGLSVWLVLKISKMRKWDSLPISTAERFARACGVDLKRLARAKEYWKRVEGKQCKLAHLQVSPEVEQINYFKRIA